MVSANRNDPSFKMLVGRLHNAGVSLRVLQQTFESDAKTIQRWGRALRSRDAQELIRVLEGRRGSRQAQPRDQGLCASALARHGEGQLLRYWQTVA